MTEADRVRQSEEGSPGLDLTNPDLPRSDQAVRLDPTEHADRASCLQASAGKTAPVNWERLARQECLSRTELFILFQELLGARDES
jgi:hypothetical protein